MAAKLGKMYFKVKKKEKSNFPLPEIKIEENQIILLLNIFSVHLKAQQLKERKTNER